MQKKVYEFISKKNSDPIVERKICKRTGKEFAIFQSDLDMLDKLSPVIWWKKFSLSTPTISPECRFQRMMMFRNERKLYKRKCSKTWKNIIALYPEEYEWQIYSPELRRSDNRDSLEFWKEYIKWKFYEDLKGQFKKVPYLNLFAFHNENSDYTNWSEWNKNCYMIFASDHNEDSYYWYSIFECKNVVDAYWCKKCENSYQIIDWINSMKIFYSQKIEDSFGIYFSYDMKNCKNCFLCTGQKDKEYCFKNKPVSKEQREREILPMIQQIFKTGQIEMYISELNKITTWVIVKNMNLINTTNWIWDLVNDSKNVLNSFEAHNTEDIRWVINANWCKDVMWWYVIVDWSQKVFESIGCSKNYWTIAVRNSRENNKNCLYSNFIMYWTNLIGAISCRHKENIILNKQYSKEEREKIAQEIISELQEKWKRWEFFDPEFSPFPYNDTVANEYFPLQKIIINWQEKIINSDWFWSLTLLEPEKFISDAILDLWWEEKIKVKRRTKENEINIPAWLESIKANEISDNINDINDEILNKVIICEVTWRPFRIVWPELQFYRKHGLPIPHKHTDIRHEERLKKRPWRELNLRNCDKCGTEMLSVYSLNHGFSQINTNSTDWFKVYCEACYSKEIYW